VAFTAIYDANVLHPPGLRDLLVRLGQTGLFRARWTEQILDETIRSILRRRPDLSASRLARTRQLMCEAIPDCLVSGHHHLIDGLELPDPNDRHVLAAAIRCSAQVIVTANLADFPRDVLQPFDIEAQGPDQFILDLVDFAPGRVATVVQQQAAALRDPPRTIEDLLETLSANGLPRAVAALRSAFDG
jgi:predicted nucleic acid-binding protein